MIDSAALSKKMDGMKNLPPLERCAAALDIGDSVLASLHGHPSKEIIEIATRLTSEIEEIRYLLASNKATDDYQTDMKLKQLRISLQSAVAEKR